MAVLCRHTVSRVLFLTLLTALAAAQDDQKQPFDCHVSIDGNTYDLTGLKGEHTVTRDSVMPPSTIHDAVTFNLCEDLAKGTAPDEDQCPPGTRACLVRTSRKNGHDDRVISVIPLANSSASYAPLSSPKGLQLTFAGASYPSVVGSEPLPQHFHMNLLCKASVSDVTFVSYNGTDLFLDWEAPAGCTFKTDPGEDTKEPSNGGDDGSGSGEKEEAVGSGLGYFFLLLFLAFVAYFALGAYYNYSTYGATGADLIPHRDFWREVPYMLRDLVSHICSAVRPRHSASRSGYIAV